MTRRSTVSEVMRPMIEGYISAYGRYIQGVFPTKDNPNHVQYCYTIGNHLKNMPELLIIGPFPGPFMAGLLNCISEMQNDQRKPFEDGDEPDVGMLPMPRLRKCTPAVRKEFTIQAGQYYGSEDYDVLQVMIGDPEGLYPDDPQCHSNYRVVLP